MEILWVSDGYVETGFGRVAQELINRLPDIPYCFELQGRKA